MADSREYDALAAQSREGDPRALATLYRRLASPLLGYLERILGERADAEDVLHDAFVRLFEGRGRYSGRGHFRRWLYTVATHLALDRLRRRQKHRELAPRVREAITPHSAPSPGEEVIYQELLRRIDCALGDVPATYAMAFHLRVREGFSYREIAAICGEAEGTLRSRVHHTLKHVRSALQEDGSQKRKRPQEKEDPR